VVTETLEDYGDEDEDVEKAKSGEWQGSLVPRVQPVFCCPVVFSLRAENASVTPSAETFHISSALGEDWLLEHKNKDVRLLVACALADILRIYAPEPPYEEETNADVIKLFIQILRGFQSPDMTPQHPSYRLFLMLCVQGRTPALFVLFSRLGFVFRTAPCFLFPGDCAQKY
jgi:hypothetical protein